MTETEGHFAAIVPILLTRAHPPDDLVLTRETALVDGGLELSSLELVRVLVQIETDLGIRLDEEELMTVDLRTVGDLADVVGRMGAAV